MVDLPSSLVAVVKSDCPTCRLIEPVLQRLAAGPSPLTVYTQDDPAFPSNIPGLVDDTRLEVSFKLNIEIVPTLIRLENGQEVERIYGWNQSEWQNFTHIEDLGADLPSFRPGCGAKNVEPGVAEKLAVRFGSHKLHARRIEIAALEDELEACFARGWSDGLPVVPPTEARVLRMLAGTKRVPDEVVGIIPPNQVECTVEKVAINAVLAGCKPEYLPVVLAAVEAACEDKFAMHGVLATTYFPGPVIIVNGPIVKAIGMNAGINVFGPGNRANATIGRALQLIVRNVGGGRPGEVDRATFGTPGKYTFCFAENEEGSPWEPLSVERGFATTASTVTLFAGGGIQPIYDQLSRTPEALARSFAECLRAVAHPRVATAADAVLVVSPEHSRVFAEAGWSKTRLYDALETLLHFPADEILRRKESDAPIAEFVPKFRPGGLTIVRAGGSAGLFSAIINGWVASGAMGSQPVTKEIKL